MENSKVGRIIFKIRRIKPGTSQLMDGNIEDSIPDQSVLEIRAVLDFAVEGKTYDEFFKFIDFSLKTNFATWDELGDLSMGFNKKDISDSLISFEFYAYPFLTRWKAEVVLEVEIENKSTGERYFPIFNFTLHPVEKDILGFSLNRELNREPYIEIPATIDENSIATSNNSTIEDKSFRLNFEKKSQEYTIQMLGIISSAENPSPSLFNRSDMTLVYPWHWDPEIMKRNLAGGPIADPTIPILQEYMELCREYYQFLIDNGQVDTVCQVFYTAWDYKTKTPPTNDPKSSEYQTWSLNHVISSLQGNIFQQIPGWEDIADYCIKNRDQIDKAAPDVILEKDITKQYLDQEIYNAQTLPAPDQINSWLEGKMKDLEENR